MKLLSLPAAQANKMVRLADTASHEDAVKVFRANLSNGPGEQYKSTDLEVLCQSYGDYIRDYLKISGGGMTASTIAKSMRAAVPLATQVEAVAFSKAIVNVLSQCRDKKKSMSSGKKLGAHTYKLCKYLATEDLDQVDQVKMEDSQDAKSQLLPYAPQEEAESQQNKKRRVQTPEEFAQWIGISIASGARSSATSSITALDSPISITSSPGKQQGHPAQLPGAAQLPQSPPAQLPQSPPKPMEELLWSRLAQVRFAGGRIVEEADMRPGPKGFAVAHWQDGSSTETEVTNMMLEAHQAQRQVRKKPAAPAVMKKPAGNIKWRDAEDEEDNKEGEEEEEEAKEDGEEDEEGEEEDQEVDEEEEVDEGENEWEHCEFWSEEWKRCKVWYFSKKSYIRFWDLSKTQKNGKPGDWSLVIGTESEDELLHKQVCKKMIPFAKEKGATKDSLRTVRARLMSEGPDVD